ncbi:MAG: polyketide synthase dehydratase domain-containing protein [Syntrophobacteraceae bacterium]
METARILHPGLKIVGVRDARFSNAIDCPQGKDRRIQLQGKTRSRECGLVECDVSLSSGTNSAFGAKADWSGIDSQAIVRMGALPGIKPVMDWISIHQEELDSRSMDHQEALRWYEDRTDLQGRYRVMDSLDGAGPGTIKGRTLYRVSTDFTHPNPAAYQYSPYLLEALLQTVCFYIGMRDENEKRSMIPLGFEYMSFERTCADGEEIVLEARMREQDEAGIVWDAQALDRNRKVIMVLKGLRMAWFAG